MKKYSILFLVVFALAFAGTNTLAEDATGTPPFGPGGRKGFDTEKTAGQERALKMRVENASGEVPGLEMRKRARTMILNGMLRRAEALLMIAGKIESRIEKIEDSGVDTGNASGLVDDAIEKIEEAKAHFAEAKEAMEDGDEISEIIEHVRLGKEALKEAHALLRQAVQEIKAGLAEEDEDNEEEEENN